MAASKGKSASTLVRKSEREIVITRRFRAPARIVFAAFTEPEFVRKWWAPSSRGVAMTECTADVRPGGDYRYVMGRGDERIEFYGRYSEVTPPSRLVYTQIFAPFPDQPVTCTVTFEEHEGLTRLVSHELYPSEEALDMAISSGMEAGALESMDQLDALVVSQT